MSKLIAIAQFGYITRDLQGTHLWMGEKAQTFPTYNARFGSNEPWMLIEEDDSVWAVEGNGLRPSHLGVGISDANAPMYTLNTTEVHAVMFEES